MSCILRLHSLLEGFLGFVFPFADLVLVHPAQREQLFLVVDHLFAADAGQGIIFHQEDRFFRAHLLAEPTEDAAEHVDLEIFWRFLHVAYFGRATRSWWRNAD